MAGFEEQKYIAEGIPFPSSLPKGYDKVEEESLKFDAEKHLALEEPSWVQTLNFEKVDFPFQSKSSKTAGFAYTAPFRVLSSEGVKALRKVIDENESFATQNGRQPKALRGLGYISEFVRQLNYSPPILDLLSRISNAPMWPHSMPMNFGHTNFGIIGSTAPVDKWHADSVDYVLVLIISDMQDMVCCSSIIHTHILLCFILSFVLAIH